MRAARTGAVRHCARRAAWPLRLHRGLLQFAAAPLRVGLRGTPRVRATTCGRDDRIQRAREPCVMKRGPVEAAGAADAQNAPTAPWKTTKQVFHSYHRTLSSCGVIWRGQNVNLSTKPGQAQFVICDLICDLALW